MVLLLDQLLYTKTRENLTLQHAKNKGTDQLVHPRSQISAFAFRSLQHVICKLAQYKLSRVYLVSEADAFHGEVFSRHDPYYYILQGMILLNLKNSCC